MPDTERARPNRNAWILVGVAVAIVIVLALILLLRKDDKKTTLAASSSSAAATTTSTSTSSTTTTTASTTTTTSATTTTTPQATIPPARCNPKTSSAKPAEPATAFYDAWRIGDRHCAEQLGTADAVNTMFALKPNGPVDEFQGCTEVADPDPHGDCAFTHEGGSTHYKLKFDATNGWSIFEVYQVAD